MVKINDISMNHSFTLEFKRRYQNFLLRKKHADVVHNIQAYRDVSTASCQSSSRILPLIDIFIFWGNQTFFMFVRLAIPSSLRL